MSGQTLVLPLHPRTSKLLKTNLQEETYQEIVNHENIKLIPPVSFLAMIALEKQSTMIITDSGGVQKEAYFFQKPCIIMRPETEWKEIVAVGAAVIADASKEKKSSEPGKLFMKTHQQTIPRFSVMVMRRVLFAGRC